MGILIFSVLILYKLIYIKSIESESFFVPKIIYSESRGDIFSHDMQLLASSPVNYNISFDPTVPSSTNFQKNYIYLQIVCRLISHLKLTQKNLSKK